MSNCKTIMLTSFKGGVGKSTLAANLGLALAKNGKRVLLVDCDFNMRCLDLMLGLESRVVYDICDVCTERVSASKAVIGDSRADSYFFLAAPYHCHDTLTVPLFRQTLYRLVQEFQPDFILLDTPGDNGLPYQLAASVSDYAFIVATHQPASIRAAEKTATQLREYGNAQARLIINNFDFSSVKRGLRPGITEIIDRTAVRLLGAVPFDPEFSRLQETGSLIDTIPNSPASVAIRNIAQRVIHPLTPLPLFSGLGKSERKTARI